MPLAARLHRVWGWLWSLLNRTSRGDSRLTISPIPVLPHQGSPPSHVRLARSERPATLGSPASPGEVLIQGQMELRMWTVGSLLVLATSLGEAEAALVGLLSHQDPDVRRGAGDMLDSLRKDRAVAA